MKKIISIFGTNGMLSTYLSIFFFNKKDVILNLYGIEKPNDYRYTNFIYTNLLENKIDYTLLAKSDLIIYAAGAGVQAALNTDSELMYKLNLYSPIEICNKLKKHEFKGAYMSFGSYMEVGINDNENVLFDEKSVELSSLPVSNDYALSKRLLTRFMGNLNAPYRFWHFILPNLFVEEEKGTRLIPYILNYLNKIKNGETCEPLSFSSGGQIRQYINLDEVCSVINIVFEISINSGIYNIGGGEVLSIKELIIRLFNFYKVPISNDFFGKETRRDGDIRCLKIDGNKLYKEINFLPNKKIESIL